MRSSKHRFALVDSLITLAYPHRCIVCNSLDTDSCLCPKCLLGIDPIAKPSCVRCGLSIHADGCPHCASRPQAFVRARACGSYSGVLQTAIHHLKYRDKPQLSVPLGIHLGAYARLHAKDLNHLAFDYVVPSPMHAHRRRLRGYNQAERIARVVAEQLEIPLAPDALFRNRNTRSQVGLKVEQRTDNLRGAFSVTHSETWSGTTVLVVDDVTTTGSTLHECAVAMKAAGAKHVYGLTLAAG